MSDDKLIEVFLNPLQFLEVDESWRSATGQGGSPESVLDFICSPGIGSKIEDMISRYKEISIEKTKLIAAPNEQRLLDKYLAVGPCKSGVYVWEFYRNYCTMWYGCRNGSCVTI